MTIPIPASANPKKQRVSFEEDVRPILKANCFHCHGESDNPKAGLDLRLKRFMTAPLAAKPVIAPGNAAQSLLLQMVKSGEMPKADKKLTAAEINTLQRWIESGAKTSRPEPESLPRGFYVTEDEKHFWSFEPLSPTLSPKATAKPKATNPLDAFVLAKQREHKLSPAPEADRLTLIRRVSLDLTGLLPTPDEVQTFLNDTQPGAYERVVDRLLESPRYGERWARYWLDAAGYADSNGYADADSLRPHAFRYRDYVIRSLYADKPLDVFIQEQLAGDELIGATTANAAELAKDPAKLELLTATGFLRLGPDGTGDEVADPKLARNQVIAETIKIVSSSLLGITTGCAQCHDHRYDPISHEDYHRMRAVFEPAFDWTQWKNPAQRLVSLYTADDRAKAEKIEAEARQQDAVAEKLRKELLEKVFEKELAKLPESLREFARTGRNTPRDKRTAEQNAFFKKYPSADVQGALDLYDPEANKKVQEESAKAAKIRGTKPPEPLVMTLLETPGRRPDTFLFARGDHEQPKQKLAPGEFTILAERTSLNSRLANHPANQPTSGRRLAFAKALTDGTHPLVARVLANRIWMHHFGRGLVATPGDFGRMGERPSHPELLDWLAQQLVDGGWKQKPFHRMIVCSATYKQSSHNQASLKADPENRFLARYKLRRLDAESIRDSILEVTGKLNLEQFGPPVPSAQDGSGRVVAARQKLDGRGDPTIAEAIGDQEFRRSIYVEARRSLPLTVLEAFDAPVMSPNCDARVLTTVTPQALLMLNDSFILAQSRHFAERLCREHPGDVRAQIQRAWTLCFLSPPPAAEVQRILNFLAEQAERVRQSVATAPVTKNPETRPDVQTLTLASFCQTLLAQNRFLYLD